MHAAASGYGQGWCWPKPSLEDASRLQGRHRGSLRHRGLRLGCPPIWLLADAAGWARLLLLMAVALVAMVGWIVVAHNLWERPEDPEQRRWAALYNGVTVLTVSAAVLAAYAIFRPPSSTLSASGST